MNPTILHPVMSKVVGQTGNLDLVWQLDKKENSELKPELKN